MNREIEAIATIVGTIVGGGILALPFILFKVGILAFIITLILGAFSSFLVTSYVAELSYSQKKIAQLPSLVSKFLGKKYKFLVLLIEEIAVAGALLSYFAGISSVLPINHIVIYAILAIISIIISYGNFLALEKSETYILIVKLLLIVLISLLVFRIPKFSAFNGKFIFLALGVSIFAFTSNSVVPEVREELGSPKSFNKVLFISYIISFLIYILFSFAFYGYLGNKVGEVATTNLIGYLYYFGIVFTIFLLLTPLMTLSLVFADVLTLDFKIDRKITAFLSGIIPFLLAIFFNRFAYIISIIGGVFISLLSLFIIIALIKERKVSKSEYRAPFGIIGVLISFLVFLIAIFLSFYEV
ncbi:MAG: amino acid permease [Candidatus Parvarchaeota archaeon]|nr:amino acid permease [Candidatus Rehaiarchaeum fermentans]